MDGLVIFNLKMICFWQLSILDLGQYNIGIFGSRIGTNSIQKQKKKGKTEKIFCSEKYLHYIYLLFGKTNCGKEGRKF